MWFKIHIKLAIYRSQSTLFLSCTTYQAYHFASLFKVVGQGQNITFFLIWLPLIISYFDPHYMSQNQSFFSFSETKLIWILSILMTRPCPHLKHPVVHNVTVLHYNTYLLRLNPEAIASSCSTASLLWLQTTW